MYLFWVIKETIIYLGKFEFDLRLLRLKKTKKKLTSFGILICS